MVWRLLAVQLNPLCTGPGFKAQSTHLQDVYLPTFCVFQFFAAHRKNKQPSLLLCALWASEDLYTGQLQAVDLSCQDIEPSCQPKPTFTATLSHQCTLVHGASLGKSHVYLYPFLFFLALSLSLCVCVCVCVCVCPMSPSNAPSAKECTTNRDPVLVAVSAG
jgi:hypothetical protein